MGLDGLVARFVLEGMGFGARETVSVTRAGIVEDIWKEKLLGGE